MLIHYDITKIIKCIHEPNLLIFCFLFFSSEFYDHNALIMQDEAPVIAGLLVGLNVIDCNLCLKGDDLDTAPSVIDFSLYLKDGNYLDKPEEGAS